MTTSLDGGGRACRFPDLAGLKAARRIYRGRWLAAAIILSLPDLWIATGQAVAATFIRHEAADR